MAKWRWLFAFGLLSLPGAALAQSCGPDAAPPQAVSGCPSGTPCYPCETYRWGPAVGLTPADTVSEIDTAQTYPGTPGGCTGWLCAPKKWYYGNFWLDGHVTVSSDYTVDVVTGAITNQIPQVPPTNAGAWLFNTCGGPDVGSGSVWTVGQYFQHGFYAEAVIEYNATGFTSLGQNTGLYGYDGLWYGNSGSESCPGGGNCYETDDPDALAFGQSIPVHHGGVASNNNNSGQSITPGTVETGTNKWGLLSTASATTWYAGNNVFNGTALYDVIGSALGLYNSKQCFGMESTHYFPLKVDSFKVWQAGSASPSQGGGGLWKMLHRR